MLEAGRCFVHTDAAYIPIQPFTDCTIGIVVIGIHAVAPETAVRFDAVPVFPDGGGAHLYLIEPGRIIILHQKGKGQIFIAVVAQGKTEIGGT